MVAKSAFPSKMFTFINAGRARKDPRARAPVGLVFVHKEGTFTDTTVRAILNDPEVEALFDDPDPGVVASIGIPHLRQIYPARQHEEVLFVTRIFTHLRPWPALWGEKYPLWVKHPEGVTCVNIKDVADVCMRLERVQLACNRCEHSADTCLRSLLAVPRQQIAVEGTVPDAQFHRFDSARLLERDDRGSWTWDSDVCEELEWTPRKTQIQGFTLMPPYLFNEEQRVDSTIPSVFSLAWEWSEIENAFRRKSRASQQAATTRKRKKEECSKCTFCARHADTCCRYAVRSCDHGAWSDERITTLTLMHLAQYFNTFDCSFNDARRAARLAGEVVWLKPAEHARPLKYVVTGNIMRPPSYDPYAARNDILLELRRVRAGHRWSTTARPLSAILKKVDASAVQAYEAPLSPLTDPDDRRVEAIAWHVRALGHVRVSAGWGCRSPRGTFTVRREWHYVDIVAYTDYQFTHHSVDSWSGFYALCEDMCLFNMHGKESEEGPRFFSERLEVRAPRYSY